MWKRSFIFLLVLAVVLCSLSAHPAWLYGKAKANETTVPAVTAEPLTPAGQEALETASTLEETQSSEEPVEPVTALRNYLTESGLEEAVLEAVYSYLDMIEAGVETMTEAYEAEVAHGKEVEGKYNALVDDGVVLKKKFEVILNPYVTAGLQEDNKLGLGLNAGVTFGHYGVSVGVAKPAFYSLETIKNPNDIMVSAGFVVKF